MSSGIRNHTAHNILVNGIGVAFVSLVQIATSIIVARMLLPGDYGVISFALVFITFVIQFGDLGINWVLIQDKELTEKRLQTAFALKIAISTATFVVVFLLSPHAAALFDNDGIVPVLRVLSLNFLVTIFLFVPQVLLTRELSFRKLVVPNMLGILASSLLTVVLAYRGYGYWSLSLGNIAYHAVSTIVFNVVRPARIVPRVDRVEARSILKAGTAIFLPTLIVFVNTNIDNLIVGAVRGARELGYYTVAFTWGTMVCILLRGIVHKVLSPTFCRLPGGIPALKKAYLDSVRNVAFLAIPVNLILFLLARDFLFHALSRGSGKWEPALVSLKILSIYGIFGALLEPVVNVLHGIGKVRLAIRPNLAVAVVELGLIYPVVRFTGIEGVAVLVLAAYMIQYLIFFPILKREIGFRPGEFLCTVKPAVLAGIAMTVPVLLLDSVLDPSLAVLAAKAATGSIVYFVCYGFVTNWEILKELKQFAIASSR